MRFGFRRSEGADPEKSRRRRGFSWPDQKLKRNICLGVAGAFVFLELVIHFELKELLGGNEFGFAAFNPGDHKFVIATVLLLLLVYFVLMARNFRFLLFSRLGSRGVLKLLIESLNASADGIALTQLDGTFVWVNEGMCRLTGYSANELIGQSPRLLKSGQQDDHYYKHLWETILSGKTFRGELINRRKDKSMYSEELVITPIKNYRGAVSHFVTITRDISERKLVEAALQESEEKFRTLVETLNDALVVLGKEDEITYANSKFLEGIGYSKEEVLGTSFSTFLDKKNREIIEKQNEASPRGEKHRYKLEIKRKSGERRTYNVSPSRILDSEGQFAGSFAVLTDITDHIRAEERNTRLGRILEDSPNEIYLFDADTFRFVMVNRGARENLGYSIDELQKMTPLELKPDFTKDSFESCIRPLRNGETEIVSFATRHRRKNGSTYPVEVHLHLSNLTATTVFVAFVADITERRAAEAALFEAKEEAENLNRLKSAILDNMSHEIRTPITGILGFADLLKETASGDQHEFVQHIQQAGHRLLATINSVLDLSQLESNNVRLVGQPCDLGALIRRTIELFHPIIDKGNVDLRVDIQREDQLLMLDEGSVNRILDNLIGNAIKFTNHGEIVIHLLDSTVIEEGVDIVIRDTGIGISKEFIPHLFDSFKQESSGSERTHNGVGLGLAITKKLVEMMGGLITVESEKGIGSIFTVSLPKILVPDDHPESRPPVERLRSLYSRNSSTTRSPDSSDS